SRHSAPAGRTLAEACVTSEGVTEGISREVNRAAEKLSPDFSSGVLLVGAPQLWHAGCPGGFANRLPGWPAGRGTAVDLAGHLRCVADDYHEYLEDAPASRLARLMSTNAPADSLGRKLARQNSAELAALPDP